MKHVDAVSSVTVEITAFASSGAGVGHLPEGRVVFVQRTAPGDRARIAIERERERWAEGRLLRLEAASPSRRKAPCPYYARCGGCVLQHVDYGTQLAAKAQAVADAITRIAHLDVEVPGIDAALGEFQYRNRATFTLLRRRHGTVIAGFHALDRPDRVVDVNGACMLLEPALAQAWNGLRSAWGSDANLLPPGARLRLTLRSAHDGTVSLLIDGGYGPGRPDRLLAKLPSLASIWQRKRRRDAPTLLAGAARLTESWREQAVRLEGGVFLQVNRRASEALEAYVLALATRHIAGTKVIDAYCGIGTYARALGKVGARVVGIERDASAVAEAERLADGNARFVTASVEEALAGELPAHLVIVNPPRGGLDESVAALLRDARPARLIYVSCDAATLARDIARLGMHASLRSLHCFDLFPQTAHIETVAELTFDACATT